MHLSLPRGLIPRHAQFLIILAARPSLTRRDYQRIIRVSRNTAKADLNYLAAAGLVRAVGFGRARRYCLGPEASLVREPPLNSPNLLQERDQDSTRTSLPIRPLAVPVSFR